MWPGTVHRIENICVQSMSYFCVVISLCFIQMALSWNLKLLRVLCTLLYHQTPWLNPFTWNVGVSFVFWYSLPQVCVYPHKKYLLIICFHVQKPWTKLVWHSWKIFLNMSILYSSKSSILIGLVNRLNQKSHWIETEARIWYVLLVPVMLLTDN